MSLPVALLDLATAAHEARRAGHSETEVARAAGFPPPPPPRRHATTDEIIARILHRDPATMHPDDLEWWRAVVAQVVHFEANP